MPLSTRACPSSLESNTSLGDQGIIEASGCDMTADLVLSDHPHHIFNCSLVATREPLIINSLKTIVKARNMMPSGGKPNGKATP